jgi:small subunit ribosomal protein S19e
VISGLSTAYDVPADLLIERVARYLKEHLSDKVKLPPSLSLVKLGSHVERAPADPDWWYIRCASLLRKLYIKGPLGISRLSAAYGGGVKRGRRPERSRKAGRAVIRRALQQLEEVGFVEKVGKEGRALTRKGRGLLDSLASKLRRELEESGRLEGIGV